MVRLKGYSAHEKTRGSATDLILDAEKYFDRFSVGTWTPATDLCESGESITVRMELPGVDLADIRISVQGGVLRVQGLKREPAASKELLCYYCLERSFGRFSREIQIDSVVNARRARAALANGVLTIELPKLEEKRGQVVDIPITGPA